MINLSNITAGLVAGLVVTSVVPALGASRVIPPGHNARAQAIQEPTGEFSVSPERDRALRDCNAKVDGMREYSMGVRRSQSYAVCMHEHGEAE